MRDILPLGAGLLAIFSAFMFGESRSDRWYWAALVSLIGFVVISAVSADA